MNNETISIENEYFEEHLAKNKLINTRNFSSYLKQLEIDDLLPFSKYKIHFSDDLWDFSSQLTVNINKTELRFYFQSIPLNYKKIAKYYVINLIFNNNCKIQTIYDKMKYLKPFFNFLNNINISNIQEIELIHVKNFINHLTNNTSLSFTSLQKYKDQIRLFFLFYDANFEPICDKEIFNYLSNKNKAVLSNWKESHKSSEIPNSYYSKMLQAFVFYMNDSNTSYWIKSISCMYIILSQTGLRCSELLDLRTTSLYAKESYNNEKLYYLNYESWKGCKGNNIKQVRFTFVNELSKKAFETLLNIPEYKERRKIWDSDILFCGIDNTPADKIPIESNLFRRYSEKFWQKLDLDGLLETINLDKEKYPFLEFRKIHRVSVKHLTNNGELIKTIAHPTTQQFRFHVCTELYNKGVRIEYIKRFMSHLTESMTEYHILTNKNDIQEDLEAAKKVISGIVTGNEKIIGRDEGLTANINKFIKENHFNIETDLDSIVSKLAEDIPIRIKTGGVCIKSSRFRPCSIDYKTSSEFCAYNVCPNIFHFFYHCGITWRKCKELKEVIDVNKKRGLLKQVCKDTNNLRSIITHQLLPEMDELQVQLKDKGINTIYEKYPDLIDIIENFNKIKQEVLTWLQKTQQEQ